MASPLICATYWRMRTRGTTRQLWLPDSSKFWAFVNQEGPIHPKLGTACWIWQGHCGEKGYGFLYPSTLPLRKTHAILSAHRVAWELHNGPIPAGRLVLHHCDNRACVRPSHLFLGDDQINSDDKQQKGRGRWVHGEKQHLAKLTEAAVRTIRDARRKSPPTPLEELATRFGVTLVAVSFAATGKTWKHITGCDPVPSLQRGGQRNKHGRFS